MHRFIHAVGGGAKVSRALTRDEAREAMGLILDGGAQPVQVGAFLMALRMKGETADELAGFVEALESRMTKMPAPPGTLDVDCHGDGHEGRPTVVVEAACAAAALGVPVLLRVDLENPKAKHGLGEQLAMDLSRPLDGERALRSLAACGVALLDLGTYAPPLKSLVDLRPLFGRRTVAQTLTKLVNPLGCAHRLVGVFHAPYLRSTADALLALKQNSSLCVQALGGLPEATPGKLLRAARPDEPETFTLDFRGAPDERAAATCALMLHAARGDELLHAAQAAREVIAQERARSVAAALARA